VLLVDESTVSASAGRFDRVPIVFPILKSFAARRVSRGTITGAPKVRTMEIIEELEPVRRGPYTGSIGWFGYQGDMTLNIVIRTLVARDGWAHVQAGAGIVIDSQPVAEYEECVNKAQALWQSVEESRAEVSSRGG